MELGTTITTVFMLVCLTTNTQTHQIVDNYAAVHPTVDDCIIESGTQLFIGEIESMEQPVQTECMCFPQQMVTKNKIFVKYEHTSEGQSHL